MLVKRRSALGCVCCVLAVAVTAGYASANPCEIVSAGLDTTFGNWSYSPIFGSDEAQSFWADDTVITALNVWRPAGNRSTIGATIYITEADSTGMPLYYGVYRAGPTVTVYDSDPPGGLIPMRFVFDPVVVLPARGEYAFFLQPEACWPGAAWYILSDLRDDYSRGSHWTTSRALSSCRLTPALGEAGDLIFEVEYCHDTVTATRKSSWGMLKARYR